MSTFMTLELSDELAKRLRELASAAKRRPEDVVVEWIGQAIAEAPSLESLPDDELLALVEARLATHDESELHDLLDRLREGLLSEVERKHLDELMAEYRAGFVRKARATAEAVRRGLRPPLGADSLEHDAAA